MISEPKKEKMEENIWIKNGWMTMQKNSKHLDIP